MLLTSLLLFAMVMFSPESLPTQNYTTRADAEEVLRERDQDKRIDPERRVLKLSDRYHIYSGVDELAVYNYYRNPNVIHHDYILETTTNNHWVQILLAEGEQKSIILEAEGYALTPDMVSIEALDAEVTYKGGCVMLNLEGGAKQRGMITVGGDEQEPLFIFVDEPIAYPTMSDRSTVVFYGYHSGNYALPQSVERVVLPLGSYFVGNITSDHDFEVEGYGIISQEGVEHKSYESGEDNQAKCNVAQYSRTATMKVRGITSIEPSMYHFWVWPGVGTEYDSVKCFGFQYESDGFIGDKIVDCFTKVNDDHIKLYISDIEVKNYTTYCQGNGNVFQFGWGNYGSRSNITVENVTLLRDLNQDDRRYARSFINWRKPDYDNTISDVVFDGIKALGPVVWFIKIDTDNEEWHNAPRLENFVIRNVELPASPKCKMNVDNSELKIEMENILFGEEQLTRQNINTYIYKENNTNITVK